MRRRWPVILIMVYVSLDVSNPLMPGALMFGASDSVEARTDRFRADDDVPPVRLTPGAERAIATEPPSAPRRPSAAPTAALSRGARVIRSRPALRAPAPSPDDPLRASGHHA
jgi:hypothetical protein